MDKPPIEMMLDGVQWKEIVAHPQHSEDDGLPIATHEGVFEMADFSMRCYRLSNGQAVFNADDFKAFLRGFFGEETS